MKPEAPSIDAAKDAGWRFAAVHPGEALVLQHSGLLNGCWRCESHHDRIGFAVEAFKLRRAVTKHGALALWNGGNVGRFELLTVERVLGRSEVPR